MDVTVTDAALLGIVLTTATASAVSARHSAITKVIGLLGLPPERVLEANAWVTPRWRAGLSWGVFLALSGVAMGWARSQARGIVGVAVCTLAGIGVGSAVGSQQGSLAPVLSKWSLRAIRRAAVLAAAGETDASDAATDLATRLERLTTTAPVLTLNLLEGQQTPADVADLLYSACFSSEEGYFQHAFLDRAPPERLWPGAEEEARVSLLNRVREEMQSGWPPDAEHAMELIDELRRWPSNTPLQTTSHVRQRDRM